MLSKYAATAVLLTAVTTASPLLSNEESLVTRQAASSYYTITGATGGVYPRLEIRDLEKTGMLQRLLWFSS
jgi:tyrosinase